jgi:hypothetical protein
MTRAARHIRASGGGRPAVSGIAFSTHLLSLVLFPSPLLSSFLFYFLT